MPPSWHNEPAVHIIGHIPSSLRVTQSDAEFPAQLAGDRLLAWLTGPTG
jgi:hypothetical protein